MTLLKEDGIKIKLKIIGDGPNLELLRNEAKSLKLLDNISFLGFKKNIFKYLVDADLLVHSSNFEGFSMAILEQYRVARMLSQQIHHMGHQKFLIMENLVH